MSSPACGAEPAFSIVIPTYHRPRALRTCLESLTRLDRPAGGFEVIVVDDGSPQPLDRIVLPFRDRLAVALLRQVNSGPGCARDLGARHARGRFLAFTDDDCLPAADWLCRLAERLNHDPTHLIGGRTLNRLHHNRYATASQLIVEVVYAFYNRDPAAATFFASNNIAVARELFHRIGGFDDQFFRAAAEDRELCDRWLHHGFRMSYAPDAVVYHAHDLSFLGFCKQHFTYGRGAWCYHQLREQRGSGRMRSDMKFHAWLPKLLRGPLEKLPPHRAAAVLSLLGIWQLANAAGFFYQRHKERRHAA